MRQAGEPSVEEILDSIKKVIARDNRDSAQELRAKRSQAVLAGKESRPAPEPAEEAGDDVLELSEARELDEKDVSEDTLDGLTNENAARSMRESLAALAMMSEPAAQPKIVRSGETSLENLTRELMRPMLAQWLDENLPEIVERLVKDEIARIARKKS